MDPPRQSREKTSRNSTLMQASDEGEDCEIGWEGDDHVVWKYL